MHNDSVSVKMTAHQLALARMHVTFMLPFKSRSTVFILAGTFLLVILANLIFEDAARFDSAMELVLGAIFLGGTWLLLIYRRESGKDAVTQFYADGFELALRPEGLRYRRPGEDHGEEGERGEIIEWAKFTHMITTARWLFFYFGKSAALIVPRAAFRSEEQFEHWIKTIAAYLPDREKR